MALPEISGEFGLVFEPELHFSGDGKPRVTARLVAKQRKKQGTEWVDGDPLFIDMVCFGSQATNLIESATKGDTIIVTGTLEYAEWTNDAGEKRGKYRIVANNVGVGLRWKPTSGLQSKTGVDAAVEGLGGTVVQEEAPF